VHRFTNKSLWDKKAKISTEESVVSGSVAMPDVEVYKFCILSGNRSISALGTAQIKAA